MDAIVPYERALGERFLATLSDAVDGLRAADDGGPRADLPDQRRGRAAADVAAHLAERDIGVWAHDSWYSLNLYKRLGYEGERGPRRLHPLQHAPRRSTGFVARARGGRARPPERGAQPRLCARRRTASTSAARARHSSGSWRCAISLPSTCTGVPCVPVVSSPSARATTA